MTLAQPPSRKRPEENAREVVDAIRLALEAAANDKTAVRVIRVILADGPPPQPRDTASVKRLLRAVKRTRYARWYVPRNVRES
jgi:hypothetical protein